MHVRFSMVRGMPVIEQQGETLIGIIDGLVVDPDRGMILAFIVMEPRLLFPGRYALLTSDIISFGTVVRVRDAERLAAFDEIIRLQPFIDSPRTILSQPIITQRGKKRIGICRDIQFTTKTYSIEWLFPSRWLRSGIPVSASDIHEVTSDAIIVRDPEKAVPLLTEEPALPVSMPSPALEC